MNRALNKVIKSHMLVAAFTFVTVVLLVSGVTYALFQVDKKNTVNQTISVGNLSASLTSVEGAVLLNDLYPKLRSELNEDDKIYEFTITNDGDYDLNYNVYLKDATEEFLASNTSYSEYKRINTEYYQYINFILDDSSEVKNLASILNSNAEFVLFSGVLSKGKSEDHKIQFFIDKGETTENGVPNDIAGSILSLDIYFVGGADSGYKSKQILAKLGKKLKEGNPDFATIATTDETADGLYAMEDDYGTSYYYRGASNDNYVKFADKYWRIIRVNGDGSVRMIYDGTSAHTNGESSTDRLAWQDQAFNAKYDDAKYVGYMYSPEGTTASTTKEEAQTNTASSDIKTKLEEWYVTNIKNQNLDGYVADNIFCYDRSTPGKEATGWSLDTGLGYGSNYTAYGATTRTGVWNSSTTPTQPQLTCTNKNDAFTKEDVTKGNGAISEKIGLITADEINIAGSGKFNTANSNYFLYKGSWYWSGSPCYYGGRAYVFDGGSGGNLTYYAVDITGGVAPVINLTADYFKTLIGDGKIGNEFREA